MFDFASLRLDKVDTIVDVGAGVGAFLGPALEFYKPKPTNYLAIEMLPERASYLGQRFGYAHVCHHAVGDMPKDSATILRTVSPDSSSLLKVNPEAQKWYDIMPHGFDQYINDGVVLTTLDKLVPHEWTVDLMKMDVQGYEGRAIRGGKDTLRRTRALIIEVLFCQHYEGQSSGKEIDDLLTGLGFRFDRWLTYDMSMSTGGKELQGDALYVNTTI